MFDWQLLLLWYKSLGRNPRLLRLSPSDPRAVSSQHFQIFYYTFDCSRNEKCRAIRSRENQNKESEENYRYLSWLRRLLSSEIRSNCRSLNRETVRKRLRTGTGAYPRNERKQRVIVFNHAFIIYRLMNWKSSRRVCSFICSSSF